MLLEYAPIPDLELLVAGHHGSKHSTSEALLEATKPEIVLISTGYNTYGHPSEELLYRLYKTGIKVYRTDVCGEISIRLNKTEVSMETKYAEYSAFRKTIAENRMKYIYHIRQRGLPQGIPSG